MVPAFSPDQIRKPDLQAVKDKVYSARVDDVSEKKK